MKPLAPKPYLLLAVTVASLAASPAQAGIIITDLADETLAGLNGLVTVGEFGNPTFGYYRVDVASGVALTGFAVSTDSSFAQTPRGGWSASNLDSTDWDALFGAGNFLSYFGSGEARVNYYHLDTGLALDDDTDQDQLAPGMWSSLESAEFFFGFPPASQFVAFGKDNAVVDYSLARTAVPDAAGTLALFSPTLLGLGWLRRKTC